MKNALILLLLLPLAGLPAFRPSVNQSSPLVDRLLAEMSLEEKVGQMTQVTIDLILKDGSDTEIDQEKLREVLLTYHVGSILNVKGGSYTAETWNTILTAIQDVATRESVSKIPVLYGIDAIHGSTYLTGATLFPHNIGLGATRNSYLMEDMAKATARQTRALGIPWNFDPVLDVARQPLWPRFEETYGEDPQLVTQLGLATVSGYERSGLEQGEQVASCMKHFIGYSVPATGKDRSPSYIPDRILREYFLPPFQAAVNAGAQTVMINSGEINGVPVHASSYYLTDILRGELGFTGVAVSDWEDVIRLHTRHKVAATPKEAVRMAVEAGLDMSMVPYDFSFYTHLLDLVREGTISEERINVSVRRILELKENLGLFDNPYPNPELADRLTDPAYDELSLMAARQSLTLLKNEGNTLPLSRDSRILLAGPAANALAPLHGSWSYTWQGTDEAKYPEKALTLKEGMEKVFGSTKISTRSVPAYFDPANVATKQLGKDAKKADVLVLALGEQAYAESPGVIDDLDLDKTQVDLVKAAAATGKKVVVVLFQGRPRVISEIEPLVDAILLAYRPATFGGQAVAEVLAGEVNPSGVLPFTYPRYAGDVVLYDHKGSEKIREDKPNTYGLGGYNPQYDFGHGLSYTTFSFSPIKASRTSFDSHDVVNLRCTITNTGQRKGTKIVELYGTDLYASITPHARRLLQFERVELNPGESREVTFYLPHSSLAFVNQKGEWVTEPGEFDLHIGDQTVRLKYEGE